VSRRAAFAAAVAALVAAAATAAARADGDPASDYLLLQNVFFPYAAPSPSVRASVEQAVDGVYDHGNRVKVALIWSADDLGSVQSLFGTPSDYARFLGIELGLWYVGPLLVVMPNGLGFSDGDRSTASADQVLHALGVTARSPDELGRAAAQALRQLVAAGALSSPDVRAPIVTAYPASARRGKPVTLHFDVFDDSGRAQAQVRVYEDRSLLATLTAPALFKIGTRAIRLRWQVPSTLRSRRLRYCVLASDPAGNRSAPGCAPFLEVR
jgi:hypothetical protein